MAVNMTVLESRDAWLKNRMKGIGGSEISAVIGCNPYMNNVDLWELKTGRRHAEDISDKPYIQYGTLAEAHLREIFQLDFPDLKVDYIENNSFQNDRFPWARASLDGWLVDQDGKLGVLEIKTSEILASQHREKWRDAVPQNYYCQTLFYMAVTEADFAIIKAHLRTAFDGSIPYTQTKHYRINRADVEEDMDYLMQEGERFWEYVKKDKRPPLVLPAL